MSSDRPPERYVPALDGLRGVAVLAVVVFHFSLPAAAPSLAVRLGQVGWIGVDLFFVLSGFLITGILYGSRHDERYFTNFYMRRTLRIMPLYYAVLLTLLVVVPAVKAYRAPAMREAVTVQPWLWTYCANFGIARWGAERFGPFLHLWSLAIEEHFYLLWPALVRALSRERLLVVCVACMAGAFVLRLALRLAGVDPITVQVLTPCRLDALATGALLALVGQGGPLGDRALRAARGVVVAGAVVVAAIFVWRGAFSNEDVAVQTVGYTALAALFGGVVALVAEPGRRGLLERACDRSWLRLCGRYSYGMYVFHPILVASAANAWVRARLDATLGAGTLHALAWIAFGVAESLLVAAVSWHVYEKHFLRLKRFFYAREAGGPANVVAFVRDVAVTGRVRATGRSEGGRG